MKIRPPLSGAADIPVLSAIQPTLKNAWSLIAVARARAMLRSIRRWSSPEDKLFGAKTLAFSFNKSQLGQGTTMTVVLPLKRPKFLHL